jgi:hypothetical protein
MERLSAGGLVAPHFVLDLLRQSAQIVHLLAQAVLAHLDLLGLVQHFVKCRGRRVTKPDLTTSLICGGPGVDAVDAEQVRGPQAQQLAPSCSL